MVATLGRTQPADRGCTDPAAVTEDAQNLCKINDYAARVVDRAAQAVANAQPLGGNPVVAARSYLVRGRGDERADPRPRVRGRHVRRSAEPGDDAAVADRATCSAR